METIQSIIIKNSTQQCNNNLKESEIDPVPASVSVNNNDNFATINHQEEPIDLTFDKSSVKTLPNFSGNHTSTKRRIIIQPKLAQQHSSSGRSNFSYAILPSITDHHHHHHHQSAEIGLNRQQEVLKMAKSIFSKRTRTLYHWMYPSASKQQIKEVVSNTWDSMPVQEKNIYVTQVLGRFGYNSANLMVNPQLGQIKELAPPILRIPPSPKLMDYNNSKNMMMINNDELQNAISSISNEASSTTTTSMDSVIMCDELLDDEEEHQQPRKRQKLTSPPVLMNHGDFEDDPELSKELAQFSMMFKNQF